MIVLYVRLKMLIKINYFTFKMLGKVILVDYMVRS